MIGTAPMMTSLDMHGFSVSLLPVTPDLVNWLVTPGAPHAWPGLNAVGLAQVRPLPDGPNPSQPVPSAHPARRALIERCCRALIAAEKDLNALDAKSGDGDMGSTLATAARALIAALDRLPLADPTLLYRAVGMELAQAMGGSSALAGADDTAAITRARAGADALSVGRQARRLQRPRRGRRGAALRGSG